ncbi:MAG: hypothetical protein P1U46_03080 [Patescibacteria group bacterium]|nr:hypothetical protein [Patescibacteria group bacterium]
MVSSLFSITIGAKFIHHQLEPAQEDITFIVFSKSSHIFSA